MALLSEGWTVEKTDNAGSRPRGLGYRHLWFLVKGEERIGLYF